MGVVSLCFVGLPYHQMLACVFNGMRNAFGGDRVAHDSRCWDGTPARLEIQVHSDLYDVQ